MTLATAASDRVVASIAVPRRRPTAHQASRPARVPQTAKLGVTVPREPLLLGLLQERLDAQVIRRVGRRQALEHLVELGIVLAARIVEELVDLLELKILPVSNDVRKTEETAVPVGHERRPRKSKPAIGGPHGRSQAAILRPNGKAIDADGAVSGFRVKVEARGPGCCHADGARNRGAGRVRPCPGPRGGWRWKIGREAPQVHATYPGRGSGGSGGQAARWAEGALRRVEEAVVAVARRRPRDAQA
jgi:hypothetical protein